MSHTSSINNVVITDIQALRATINELKGLGIKCDLLENQLPRAYYSNQSGMSEKAPYVVKLHDSRYDVGLYPREDGKGLECRCDTWGDDIKKQLGSNEAGVAGYQNAIGKLLNVYAVNALTRKAVMSGNKVQRVTKEDGSVQVRITA